MHNATLVKIEEASTAAYNKAILLILLIGFIMLVGNIWFWLCFVIRKRSHTCCMGAQHAVGKDISCETELVGSSNTSLQNLQNYSFYQQKEYSSDKISCKGRHFNIDFYRRDPVQGGVAGGKHGVYQMNARLGG